MEGRASVVVEGRKKRPVKGEFMSHIAWDLAVVRWSSGGHDDACGWVGGMVQR